MKRLLLLCFVLQGFKIIFAQEDGYPSKLSVFQGDTLKLHISTSINPYTISIYKYIGSDSLIRHFNNIPGGIRSVPDSSYYYGCGWPVSLSFVIPNNWLPGVYKASFPTSSGSKSFQFIVKDRVPGNYSKIAYVLSTNTWEAYNTFGGKSLYDNNPPGSTRSYKVSFLRPFDAGNEFFGETPFIRWIYKFNVSVEFFTDYDLYATPGLLTNYKILVFVNHSEYWSYPGRSSVEHFLNNGGNIVILSGNTCWWQVRYENSGNTLVCYKDQTLDPLNNITDSLVTVNWRRAPVNKPENPLTGMSFIAAGYVNYGNILPQSQGYGGYTVSNDHFWVYQGTGLINGDDYSYTDNIAGFENDGALFNFVNGTPVFTGADFSPTNFRVLGFTPTYQDWGFTTNPHGFIGLFHKPGGGMVFNAGSMYFVKGLDTDVRVEMLLKNVFNKFYANKFPPEITSWSPSNIVNTTIHNESVPVNKRVFLKKDNSSVNFSVTTVDPYSQPVHYTWKVNGASTSGGSSFTLSNYNSLIKDNEVSVFVNNNVDTSSITWNYFNTELALYGDPQTEALPATNYFTRIKVFNYYNDAVTLLYFGPSWLTISSNGEIKGTTPSVPGTFAITIIARNQHNQADTLSYNLHVSDTFLPIELSLFTGTNVDNKVLLKWETTTEINNYGFEVEKSIDKNKWDKIAFEPGFGESNIVHKYSYVDNNVTTGIYYYRLKQIDSDGHYYYSEPLMIKIEMPEKFLLSQNYPNPFNPSTSIEYSIPHNSVVTIRIFDILGNEITTLLNEQKETGKYLITFDGARLGLSSGIYFYRMSTKEFSETKPLVFIK